YEFQEVDSTILQSYVGKYTIEGDIAEIYMTSSGNLKISYQGASMDLDPLNESTFVASHWFLNVGDIKVKFVEDYMIVTLEDVAHMICPSYEIDEVILSSWTPYLGNYEAWRRHYSVYTGIEIPDHVTLKVEDGVLLLNWFNDFILEPISSTQLMIVSGPFDGELMDLDINTGFIYWQNYVFKTTNS
ncbi:MAG: hypothetical protein ACTSQC_10050, partial [Candidatus Heimdallarchaeaceae archaeon]